ncbi:MAG: hypothetical protein J7M05_00075, partial [Anaerolineae bacterium]|nr:hypothetical protein [Anaerolineae bacterium]
YTQRLKRLEDRLEREEQELEEDLIEYEGRKREELLSAGESLLSFVLGRRRTRVLSTASRRRRLTLKAKADVEESEETIEELKKEINALREEQEKALEEVRQEWAGVAEAIEETALRPKKSDIRVEAFGLAWVPHWVFIYRDARGQRRQESVPAYLPPER